MTVNTVEYPALFEPVPEVLIVDDVSENLEVLAGILAGANYPVEISFAMSGEQALAAIGSHPPDLVLLDVNMPGLDGFTVCAHLQQQPDTRTIPVIFLTARIAQADLERGFAVGGVDFVSKPFNQRELLRRVQTHLELKRLRQHWQAYQQHRL